MTDCYFGELPEKFLEYIKERLIRLDQLRAGSIFPDTFEDGMRYVYCQILQENKREKEIIEAYTKLRKLQFDRFHIKNTLLNKTHEHRLAQKRKVDEE